MNKKEIAELRRRFNPDKNNITLIRGCYVDEKRQIVSELCEPALSIPMEELEKYMAIFRRALSGEAGRNLTDVVFRPDQVMEGEEHKLLMALRDTQLRDDKAISAFYERVIESLALEGNYLILLAHDAFDLPAKFADAESEEVFQYILCAVCPVKQSRPALSYFAAENEFHNRVPDWVVAAPEVGFLFPAFDDRATNIYNALYYTRDAAEPHEELTDALFGVEMPMAAAAQKEAFEAVLEDSLAEDLSYEVVMAVQGELREKIEEKKADKEAEAPTVSKHEVKNLLRKQGVPEARVQAFEEKYDETFGKGVDLNARAVAEVKKLELVTPDVVIRVAPDRADLVETRVIDGIKYILIRADEGVEVNGVDIRI
jgi:hypothetical protein